LALYEGIFSHNEPRYNGKTLRSWSTIYFCDAVIYSNAATDASNALRAIGTNAVPVLTRECLIESPAIKSTILELVPFIARARLQLFTDQERHSIAAASLRCLGEDGQGAIPILCKQLDSPNSAIRENTAFVLGEIGPTAESSVTALLNHVYDPAENVQFTVRNALGEIHQHANLIVPALAGSLDKQHATNYCFMSSIVVLGTFGTDALPAVTNIIPFLNHSNYVVRMEATNALNCISPHALHVASPFK
jgi:HEAT repeat protein